ncbi:MAG TPA: arylesterase [Woeseiaceae bacterium]
MRNLLFSSLVFLASAAHGGEDGTIMVFGDSLSAGYGIDIDQSWTHLLQQRLHNEGYEYTVVNASISGDTTESGAARIGPALEKFAPTLVILELGGNDGLRGIPLERMQDNLLSIVNQSKAAGAAVILLGIRIPTNYGPRYTEAFEAVFRDIATQTETPWIEFFIEGVALRPELMQDDGIHPNAEAQPVLLDNAWPIILQALRLPTDTGS